MPGKSTLVVCHDDRDTLKFVAGIINSQLASFFIKQKYASASYNGGVNFTPDMLDSIPIADGINVEAIVSCVDTLLSAQEKILRESFVVHSVIRASGGPAKLRKQFDRWYLLSNAEFINELERQGLSLSIRDKAEWVEILEEGKAKIGPSVTAVATADAQIDDFLFDAYGLDAAERKLVKELC